jgi:hypothetical protein
MVGCLKPSILFVRSSMIFEYLTFLHQTYKNLQCKIFQIKRSYDAMICDEKYHKEW